MKYRIDNITFAVSNVSLVESSIGSKVSLLLTYLDNEKEFVLVADNIQALDRAIKNKDIEKKHRSLFRQVRKKLKNPVMDWIYNASNEDMPFKLKEEPIRKPRPKRKKIELSDKVEPKPLHLILMREYFNQIIEGTKTTEYRDHTPFYTSRLMRDGKYRNFEVVRFQEGYRKDARRMIVEIEKVVLFNGIFEIHLGKIIERNF